jgi:hypothetical protein
MQRQPLGFPPPSEAAAAFAVDVIERTFVRSASSTFLAALRSDLRRSGIAAAIRSHDTPALFSWLVSTLSFQGISDGVAEGFMRDHGEVSWTDLRRALRPKAKCELLDSYWQFEGCGYRKQANICSRPQSFGSCALPKFPLRNGRLNQTAASLHLFIRDIAGRDLIAWMDAVLAEVTGDPARQADVLLDATRGIYGVAQKTASMLLSTILLGTERKGSAKFEVGSSFVVVDTLVHNFLHRTGVLQALCFEHPYGVRCYSARGCTRAIRLAAARIDARVIDAQLPAHFPRMVQHALWRFCAERELDICNGNRIRDGRRCGNRACTFSMICSDAPRPFALRSAFSLATSS